MQPDCARRPHRQAAIPGRLVRPANARPRRPGGWRLRLAIPKPRPARAEEVRLARPDQAGPDRDRRPAAPGPGRPRRQPGQEHGPTHASARPTQIRSQDARCPPHDRPVRVRPAARSGVAQSPRRRPPQRTRCLAPRYRPPRARPVRLVREIRSQPRLATPLRLRPGPTALLTRAVRLPQPARSPQKVRRAAPGVLPPAWSQPDQATAGGCRRPGELRPPAIRARTRSPRPGGPSWCGG